MNNNLDAKRTERMIEQQAKQDERTLQHLVKDVKSAEKHDNKGAKYVDKAQHAVDKAVHKEQKMQNKLNAAAHKHEVAVGDISSAEKNLETRKQHSIKLEQDLQLKRQQLEDFEQKKAANDHARETKLAELHMAAANTAQETLSRGGTTRTAPHTREGTVDTVGTSASGASGTRVGGGSMDETGMKMPEPATQAPVERPTVA